MSLGTFLTEKFIDWQKETKERKTLEDFANYIGVERSLLSKWMNGKQNPGPDSKKLLVKLYGDEAIEAMGDDPDLFVINENWEWLNPETRRHLRAEVEQRAHEAIERSSKKRRTSETK